MSDLGKPQETSETEATVKPKLRPCLRCKQTFASTWSGERICSRCKNTTAWRAGTPATFGSSGRRV